MTNEERIRQLEAENNALKSEVERLQTRVDWLCKQHFGQKSEKTEYLADGQLSLFNEAEKENDTEAEKKPTVVKGHTRKPRRTHEELTKDLPAEEVVEELPPEERTCPECGSEMQPVGKEFVRDELVYVPAKLYVRKVYVQTYKCDRCEPETEKTCFKKAAVPEPMIPRSYCTPELLAHILYEKYVNGIPLYRQEKDFAAKGVPISRAAMANWVIYAAKKYGEPLYERLHKELLQSKVIHADETVVQVLKEPGQKAKTDSRMWVYCSGKTNERQIVLYEYQPTRKGDCAAQFLTGFGGYLVTDGYAGYNKLTFATHCGCWAHARRKFVEALPSDKEAAKTSMAAKGIQYIDSLFQWERTGDDMPAKDMKKAQEIVDAFYEWLGSFTSGGQKLQSAVGYALSQKKNLTAFLQDPIIPLSNNRAENAIRPFVIGRKNWLFCDTPGGAKASAVFYSLAETAKVNSKDIENFFAEILNPVNQLDLLACLP
ncbi:MAG: IS66 family transposase [Clostridia bacterium]|nr:IS66 family transposase [Clostridia bacterium]